MNRKMLVWLMAAVLALACWATAAADGETWICPTCGQTGNTGNYCSNCATARVSGTEIDGCSLTMKLATRSGPGTEYGEPGTFFINSWQSQTVKVIKKSFDGSVWWVQVDFRNGNKSSYRIWTGAKRVNVDLNSVREELPLGDCDVLPTADTWYGPGGNYAKAKQSIPETAFGIVFQMENGYADVEYLCYDSGEKGRVWVKQDRIVGLDTSTDRSGE